MTTLTMTKDQIREKIGKKNWLDDQKVLAAKLVYLKGIDFFDQILDGKTLTEIDGVIHLEKYPKGLLLKIARGFGGIKTHPYPLTNDEIKKTILTNKPKENQKDVKESVNIQKHGFPALLSFFIPGVGQLMKGHFLKAFVIWISGVFIWFAFLGSLISGQLGMSAVLYVIPFVIWLWNVYDAYNSNKKWSERASNFDNYAQLIFEKENGQKVIFEIKQKDLTEVTDFLKEIKLDFKNDYKHDA